MPSAGQKGEKYMSGVMGESGVLERFEERYGPCSASLREALGLCAAGGDELEACNVGDCVGRAAGSVPGEVLAREYSADCECPSGLSAMAFEDALGAADLALARCASVRPQDRINAYSEVWAAAAATFIAKCIAPLDFGDPEALAGWIFKAAGAKNVARMAQAIVAWHLNGLSRGGPRILEYGRLTRCGFPRMDEGEEDEFHFCCLENALRAAPESYLSDELAECSVRNLSPGRIEAGYGESAEQTERRKRFERLKTFREKADLEQGVPQSKPMSRRSI